MRTTLPRSAIAGLLALVGGATPGCAGPGAREPMIAPGAEDTPSPPLHAAQADFTLSFLGLNDLHGRLKALPGFAGYAANLRRTRAAEGGAVALVDAGDMFQGTLESNLTEGATVISAYRTLGITAAALGNHEFDFGPVGDTTEGDPQGAIKARIREATFPMLSANLVVRGTHESPGWEKLTRSAIVEVGGVHVGFVGLLTAETPSIVAAPLFVGLGVDPLAPALVQEARALRAAGAEVVVALAHAGADCKDFSNPEDISSCRPDAEIFDVARALPPGTVDAIFGGHSHAGVAHVVNGIPIAEAYAAGRAFSRIDLRISGATHHVQSQQVFPPHDLCPSLVADGGCPLSDYEGQATIEDPALLTAIMPALAMVESRRQEPVGCTLSKPFTGEHDAESPLGNLFADLIRDSVIGADAAILNGGSLRADLPAGPLSYGELYEAMPFDNTLAAVHLTGAELKRMLAAHLSHDEHGIVSVSGLRIVAACGKSGLEVSVYRTNGRAIGDSETLLIATSNYLATGGDNLFPALKLGADRVQVNTGRSFRDALAKALKQHPRLSPSAPLFDPTHPRMKLSSPRPLTCSQ
ncbi:MAG: bifunctional UDP-sugar hydrolase/5'-nucleotidase [Pseudomonadota bacterium]